MLAIAVKVKRKIIGVEGLDHQIILPLYADDIVFSLQNPLGTLEALKTILDTYSLASGYKSNESKLVMMRLNIGDTLREHLTSC